MALSRVAVRGTHPTQTNHLHGPASCCAGAGWLLGRRGFPLHTLHSPCCNYKVQECFSAKGDKWTGGCLLGVRAVLGLKLLPMGCPVTSSWDPPAWTWPKLYKAPLACSQEVFQLQSSVWLPPGFQKILLYCLQKSTESFHLNKCLFYHGGKKREKYPCIWDLTKLKGSCSMGCLG